MPHRRALTALAAAAGLVGAAGCGPLAAGNADRDEPGVARVVRVVDGDTLRVRISGREERVRLIGIDTPETHGRGGLRECFGKESTEKMRSLLPPGTPVRLRADREQRDRYGRLLAYVYRDHDGMFVNLTMAREGYAAAYQYPPNVTHSVELSAAEREARSANLGLWGRCGGPDTPIG